MHKFPRGGLLGKVQSLLDWLKEFNISNHAASSCYFLVLSLFPALVLLLGVLRFTTLQLTDLLDLLEGVIPDVLLPPVTRFLSSTYDSTSGVLVSVSAVTALWSASRGIHSLVVGIDGIYGIRKPRSYLRVRLLSILYTILFVAVLLLTLVLHVFGNTILAWLSNHSNPVTRFFTEVLDLRFFLLLFVQTALFTAMYMFLPTRRSKFREAVPGALLSSIGWLTFSDLFSIYVENFNKYANVYGSVYTVALAMLWLYFCISIVFYGGALNRLLMDWPVTE